MKKENDLESQTWNGAIHWLIGYIEFSDIAVFDSAHPEEAAADAWRIAERPEIRNWYGKVAAIHELGLENDPEITGSYDRDEIAGQLMEKRLIGENGVTYDLPAPKGPGTWASPDESRYFEVRGPRIRRRIFRTYP